MDVTAPKPVAEAEQVAAWDAAFSRALADVQQAANEWGLRRAQPEGKFISAMLAAMKMLGELSRTGQAALARSAEEGRAAAEAELGKVRELRKTVEGINLQSRNLQLASVVQREELIQRMIRETWPLFADRLKGVLVIRENRWNRQGAFRRCALAAAAAVALFAGGYGLCWLGARGRLAVIDRCLAEPIVVQGTIYCAAGAAPANPAGATEPGAGQSGGGQR